MRFIHTADWQIGKPFRNFGDRESLLRQARLTAISTIGQLAMTERAPTVLIAGDLYDSEAPSPKTLLEPLERMRAFANVAWHLIPGNHDPHRSNGLWDRLRAQGLPGNVIPHLAPEPFALGSVAMLLPAPLCRKSEASDLSDWMESAATPAGMLRIGLAHGAITGFETGGEANNPIAPGRAQSAGLDYLALGDWHRTLKVNDRAWYAGTPEPDRFGSQEQGTALLVDIEGPGAPPMVKACRTGTYRWLTTDVRITSAEDIPGLEAGLRAHPDLSSLLLRLRITGALDLAARSDLSTRLAALEAAMLWLDADVTGLHVTPTMADLERIDFGGVLREAAETLKSRTEDAALSATERRRAEEALVELFLLTRGTGAAA